MVPLPLPEFSWLIVVDMQKAFLDPSVPWSAKDNGHAIIDPIKQLANKWGRDRTIFTRYIARDGNSFPGSWGEYFKIPSNTFYDLDKDHLIFDVIPELEGLAGTTVAMPVFNKWGDRHLGVRSKIREPYPHVLICGLSVECCVWSTAAAAAESGAFVTLVSDACAASDNNVRDAVWETMLPSYGGLITLASSADLLAS